jgi:hypothetical protein
MQEELTYFARSEDYRQFAATGIAASTSSGQGFFEGHVVEESIAAKKWLTDLGEYCRSPGFRVTSF